MSEIRAWETDVASSCSLRDNTLDVEVIQTMFRKKMLTDLQNLCMKV